MVALTRYGHHHCVVFEFVDLEEAFGLHLDWFLEGAAYFTTPSLHIRDITRAVGLSLLTLQKLIGDIHVAVAGLAEGRL